MKRTNSIRLCLSIIFLAVTALYAAVPGSLTYQGRLNVGGSTYSGTAYFQCALVDSTGTHTYWSNDGSSSGGSEPTSSVQLTVSSGLFNVNLGDTSVTNMTQAIPASIFTNSAVYLQIWVSTNGTSFQVLSPATHLTANGYALNAAQAESVADGTITSAKLATNINLTTSGTIVATTFGGDGSGLTNLNASDISTGTVSDSRLSSNVALLNATTNVFTGTVQAVTLLGGVNNYLSNATSGTISGGTGNTVSGNGSTVSGGKSNSATNDYTVVGGGINNSAGSTDATVSGGSANANFGGAGTISGGEKNSIPHGVNDGVIGGGYNNTNYGDSSTIGGGSQNYANSTLVSIGGGAGNIANAPNSTISGGANNTIGLSGGYGMIPGGKNNYVNGSYSFAGGLRANATNNGVFVWADSQNADFGSTANNQFLIRATNGVGINTNNPQSALHVNGTVTANLYKGDGSGLTNVGTSGLSSTFVSNTFWMLSGNSGTAPGSQYIGTSDNQPVEVKVNGIRAMRLQQSTFAPSIVGGYSGNAISTSVSGAIIGNGGTTGSPNSITANFGFIGAGTANKTSGQSAVVSGGDENTASGDDSVVPGGMSNTASGVSSFAAGYRAKATNDNTFVWAAGVDSDFTSTAANQFLIRATAGVGIGTNNPQSALHVVGTVTATAFSGDGSSLTGLSASQVSTGTLNDNQLSSNVPLLNGTQTFSGLNTFAKALTLSSNLNVDSGTLVVDATNNRVGIGISAPNVPLEISSTNNFVLQMDGSNTTGTWLKIRNSTTGGDDWRFISTGSANGEGSGKLLIQSAAGGTRMQFDTNGNVSIGYAGSTTLTNKLDVNGTVRCTTLYQTSDGRMKKDIAPLGGTLDKVMALKPATYRFKTDSESAPEHVGFIAQEVQQVFPDAVQNSGEHLALDYTSLNVAGIKALQELKQEKDAEVSALRKENAALQERLAALETLMRGFKERSEATK